MKRCLALFASLVGALVALASAAAAQVVAPADDSPAAHYNLLCASCHGVQRTGMMGPALLPESLRRLHVDEAARVIARGRPATQMPGFEEALSAAQIAALARWIYTPVVPAPSWSDDDIRASRVQEVDATTLPNRPQWRADPMNVFVVVESGDHHVSIVDGDRFEVMHRFQSRFALHGGPKFTPDGRFVYFGSRDGWVTKFDLWNLRVVAEVRAGLNLRNVAVSGDGRWVLVANLLPHRVVLFDANLNLVRSYAAVAAAGGASSRVSAVYDALPRGSFIVAFMDIAELWELPYTGPAKSRFEPRRIVLDEPLHDFFFDPPVRHVLGATRPKTDGEPNAQVVDLDAGRRVAALPIAGMPHLASGITFEWEGRRVMVSSNLQGGGLDVIELGSWRHLKTIPTAGPGFFVRSHENTPYAWADSMLSPSGRDTLTIFDKRTLKPVRTVREPGRTLAHIEFTRDGSHALASLIEGDGALIIFDAVTFAEVKRLPMRRPVGKYNVHNKVTRSEGTSH